MPRELAGDRLLFLGSFTQDVPHFDLPEVAFAGRSNVGKSSAINALVGSARAARVSRRPGCTRTLNLFEVDHSYVLCDLPGYGFARVPEEERLTWREMVGGYIEGREALAGVVLLVDPRREPGGLDGDLLDYVRSEGLDLLVVATKVDKLKREELRQARLQLCHSYGLSDHSLLAFSATDKTGLDELRVRVHKMAGIKKKPR